MTRLLTAAVLVPLTWYLCKRAPFAVFLVAALATIAAATWEAYDLLEARGTRPLRLLGTALGLLVAWTFSSLTPGFDPTTALATAAVAVPVAAMAWRREPGEILDTTLATLAPVVLVGFTLAHAIGLRAVPGDRGSDLLLLLLLCTALSDAAAYYVGSALGRRKMAPRISPKKTWEGAAGGLLGSVGGALIAHFWFYQRLALEHALAVAVVIWGAGIFGDLAESAWKRAAGVKDSSGLLPGHGGMLDRVDSLLVAAPVLYYYWRAFLQG